MKPVSTQSSVHQTNACVPLFKAPADKRSVSEATLPLKAAADVDDGGLRKSGREIAYEHGSAMCKSYSDQTMKIRMLAQQLIIAYGIGVGFSLEKSAAGGVLIFGGAALALFGAALWVLNQHYSSAFNEVRNSSLIEIEKSFLPGQMGPWTAHRQCRERQSRITYWAWHGPFAAVIAMGIIGAILGLMMF